MDGWPNRQADIGILNYATGKHALRAHLRTPSFELHFTKR